MHGNHILDTIEYTSRRSADHPEHPGLQARPEHPDKQPHDRMHAVTPQVISTVDQMSQVLRVWRRAGDSVALVPTMGALHEGHMALVEAAGERADRVIVSVFVNPTQFGPDEDYARYPRSLDTDVAKLAAVGVADAVFAPGVDDLYPDSEDGQVVWIDTTGLDRVLCGRYRPDHFRGVATVVAKLFNACRPDTAVFGLKDAQQFVILRKMVRDLLFPVNIVGVPIQREADGLALSSRNVYLSSEQRAQSTVLFASVERARSLIEEGERDATVIEMAMTSELRKSPLARVQYASVVDANNLTPVAQIELGSEVLAAVAVYFGSTRLIDNVFSRSPSR